MVAPSLHPKPSIKSNRTIVSCNKCDICKNFLITDSKFRCTVTSKTYFLISLKHSHKKRKDNLETRAVLLIFPLEIEISGETVQSIHQNSKKW